jgi:FkbM family methyltransferase
MIKRRWPVIRALPRVLRWWMVSQSGTESLHRIPGFPVPLFLHPKFRHVGSLGLYAFGTGYEPGLAFLPNLVRRGDAVFDCGANQGGYALYAGALVGPEGRVVAIEPQSYATRALRTSAAAAGFDHVSCVEAVVTEATGFETFHAGGSAVSASLYRTDLPDAIRVPSVNIDSIRRDRALPPVSVIKLDVEGAELRALQGADETLKRDRPFVIFEVWDPEDPKSAAAAQHLRSLDYELFDILDGQRVKHLGDTLIHSLNVLGAPAEKRGALAPFER